MKECLFYKKMKGWGVQCELCPKSCVVRVKERGDCKIRENREGKLYSLVYGKPCSVAVDPIEKKPIYHALPGSKSYSIGTAGCNFHCLFCQNWTTAQAKPEGVVVADLMPEEVVKNAITEGCKSVAYTYNEPIIFYEYMLNSAKLAKRKGLKNVIVCNGFINEEPLNELCKYIDAANIDLKAFNDKFYREICGGWLEPILNNLKILKEKKVWLEITNLVIPGKNDDLKEIEMMCKWVKRELGKDVPLHFSRFFPCYKMMGEGVTPLSTLEKVAKVAKKHLNYVYVGNVVTEHGEDTFCPSCKKLLIKRERFSILQNNIKKGSCECGEKIPGLWE